MKLNTCRLAFLSFVIYSMPAAGEVVEDDQQQLLASCQILANQSKSVKSGPCIYYIQGLLTGLRLIASANGTTQNEASGERSSFIERALRNRVSDRANTRQSSALNRICLPEGESLAQVVGVLSHSLSSSVETTEMLKGRIFHTLKQEYPCT